MGLLADVSENRLDAVRSGLRAGRYDAAQNKDGAGNTALHLAAEKGAAQMVRALLEESE